MSRCEAALAALTFLDTLKFSCDTTGSLLRSDCPDCGKAVRLYCSKCVQSVIPLPQPLDLGLQVLILRHPKEAAAKSSATPLPLLSRDIEVCEWQSNSCPENCSAMGPGTWLVFPSQEPVGIPDSFHTSQLIMPIVFILIIITIIIISINYYYCYYCYYDY